MMLSDKEFEGTFNLMMQCGATDELIVHQFRWSLYEIIQENWMTIISTFVNALNLLVKHYEHFKALSSCQNETINLLLQQIKVVIFPSISDKLVKILELFFEIGFDTYNKCEEPGEIPGSSHICAGWDADSASCNCHQLFQLFDDGVEKLSTLCLLGWLTGDIVVRTAFSLVNKKVNAVCEVREFDVPHLDRLLQWLRTTVVPWLSRLCTEENRLLDKEIMRLETALFDSVGRTLISQLFSIVVDYPDSEAALSDLAKCLDRCLLRTHLTESLRRDIDRRLLIISVSTGDVLQAYMSAVKSLRFLDPRGMLMHVICQPIRQYLRNRPDTVRCIVSFLTEQNQDEMDAELCRKEGLMLDDPDTDDEDPEDEGDWKTWTPDPIDAPVQGSVRSRRSADLISMLVSVYGSKDLFVEEYRQLLSERLLKSWDKDIRFGENELQQCEVMLKDVNDSVKINNFARAELTLKASRTLDWRTSLGGVELELEMNGNTTALIAGPIQMAIIWLFQEKNEWTLDELSTRLSTRPSIVKWRLKWWQQTGLLMFDDDRNLWSLNDNFDANMMDQLQHADVDSGPEDGEEIGGLQSELDGLEQYWDYIHRHLATGTQGGIRPERVHSLLRMFASPGQQGPTIELVTSFLQRKVKQELLVCSGGIYKTPSK